MINFEKELSKFSFVNIDASITNETSDIYILMDTVNSTLKRIGKEQSETNMQIEEIMIALDHETELNDLIKELQNTITQSQKTSTLEQKKLIDTILTISDQIEDLYHYTLKYENTELAKQMKILWDNIGASLIGCGVTRIDQIGIKINPQMNIPIQTSYDENQLEGTILEVLKSGYIYNTQILRKAQVTINNKEGTVYE